MSTLRLALVTLLLAAPVLCAQSAEKNDNKTANAGMKAAHARSSISLDKARHAADGPLQIMIAFKKSHGGKVTTDKIYTLVATTGETPPVIRDDARVRTNANDAKEFLDSNTDIDILEFRKLTNSVALVLKISTQTFTMDVIEGLPKLPIAHTHQYIITPTVPLGKLTTVYSAEDGIHDNKVEVQLLVQPLNAQ